MNLSKRGKWLTGIAALIAAYVAFGPKDSDSVEPARHTAAAPAHAPRAATTLSAPVARSLLALAHRVVDPTAAGALFKPVAPPLPFTYMGSYAPNGAKPVFFLTQGDRVYDVHIGDTLDGTYSVDAFNNGALVFTYKPLNQQQQLNTGGAP